MALSPIAMRALFARMAAKVGARAGAAKVAASGIGGGARVAAGAAMAAGMEGVGAGARALGSAGRFSKLAGNIARQSVVNPVSAGAAVAGGVAGGVIGERRRASQPGATLGARVGAAVKGAAIGAGAGGFGASAYQAAGLAQHAAGLMRPGVMRNQRARLWRAAQGRRVSDAMAQKVKSTPLRAPLGGAPASMVSGARAMPGGGTDVNMNRSIWQTGRPMNRMAGVTSPASPGFRPLRPRRGI